MRRWDAWGTSGGGGSPRGRRLIVAVLVLGVVATASPVAATEAVAATGSVDRDAPPSICGQSADGLVAAYNGNIEDVPGFVRGRVSDGRIHGVVNGPGGDHYTFVTDGKGRVETYRQGKPPGARLRVITDCEAFGSITAADDPTEGFWREYRADNVEFVGVGVVGSILVDGIEVVAAFGDQIARMTPLGYWEATATGAVLLLLGLIFGVPLVSYVVVRRIWLYRSHGV